MKGFDNDASAFLTTYHNDPYSSSLDSTATTSSDSVWSAIASQSSNETSPSSSDSDHCDSYTLSRQAARSGSSWNKPAAQPAPATAVPTELRQNPRRSGGSATRCPPTLVRQCDRKVNFVDNLVGKMRLPG